MQDQTTTREEQEAHAAPDVVEQDETNQASAREVRQASLARLRRRVLVDFPHLSGRARHALRLFLLDGLLVSTSTSLVSSYLTLYVLQFGASSAQIGLISTVIAVAGVLAFLPGAQIAERWMDPKRMVLIFSRGLGQVAWAALAALPFVLSGQPAVYAILALRAGRAFTVQAANSTWTSLAGQIVPYELRGQYFGMRNIAKQAAALVIIPAAGWLIDYLGFPAGYQVCFALAAAVGVLDFLTYARIRFAPPKRQGPEPEEEGEDDDPPLWADRSARLNFWAYCGTSVIWAFSMQLAAPFFVVYLVKVLGARAGVVGTLSALANLTALPGQALFGRWLDRRGIKWTFRLSGLLIPLLPWSWLLVSGPWGALPINMGSGFLMAGYNLSNFNMLLAVTPDRRRTHQIALYKTIVQSAAAIAPLLGGVLVDRFGFLLVFVLSGIGRLLSTVLLLRFVHDPVALQRRAE